MDCLYSAGRPTFSCGTEDSANSDSVESCTSESIQIFNNNQLFLNTTLSFVGGGECESESVHQIQLYYHEDVIWGYNFETLEIFERNVSMIQSDNIETDHHSFNFNIGHVNVNSSGLYELRVQLNDSENELIKTFNVTGKPLYLMMCRSVIAFVNQNVQKKNDLSYIRSTSTLIIYCLGSMGLF